MAVYQQEHVCTSMSAPWHKFRSLSQDYNAVALLWLYSVCHCLPQSAALLQQELVLLVCQKFHEIEAKAFFLRLEPMVA
jgi:hypothetical protein